MNGFCTNLLQRHHLASEKWAGRYKGRSCPAHYPQPLLWHLTLKIPYPTSEWVPTDTLLHLLYFSDFLVCAMGAFRCVRELIASHPRCFDLYQLFSYRLPYPLHILTVLNLKQPHTLWGASWSLQIQHAPNYTHPSPENLCLLLYFSVLLHGHPTSKLRRHMRLFAANRSWPDALPPKHF